MKKSIKRTIKEVLNYETGDPIDADAFFQRPLDEIHFYRSELQSAINKKREKLFVCYYCKQLIRIRGGGNIPGKKKVDSFHFAHLKDSDECHIKTKLKLSKEEYDAIKYNGAKESPLHISLKEKIAECLHKNEINNLGISKIEVEKIIKSQKLDKEWKKPDINALFNDKRIAVELQLSTTWLDVINKRQHFYKGQEIYIFWIFNSFNIDDEVRKLTYNDVIYTNNQNAFVFDEETYQKSKEANDLVLKCYYKNYISKGLTILENWEFSYIKLSDLTFDKKNCKIYYFDSNSKKEDINAEIIELHRQYEEINTQKIKEEEETKKKDEEIARVKYLQEQEKKRLQDEKNEKIKNLDQIISSLSEKKYASDNEMETIDYELEDINSALTKVEIYSNKIIDYILKKDFIIRFKKGEEVMKLIESAITDAINTGFYQIEKKEDEKKEIVQKIKNIEKIPSIVINSIVFSCLDEKKIWNYILNNQEQIFIIKKAYKNDLFAGDELKPISSCVYIDRLRYSTEYLFLIDYSKQLIVFKKNLENIENEINQNQSIILTQKVEIKNIINKFFTNEKIKWESKRAQKLKDIENFLVEIEEVRESKMILIKEYSKQIK